MTIRTLLHYCDASNLDIEIYEDGKSIFFDSAYEIPPDLLDLKVYSYHIDPSAVSAWSGNDVLMTIEIG